MKSIILFLTFFSICKISITQSGKPMIGSDTDIKEKLTTIKKSFPDLIKDFGKNPETEGAFTKYQTGFEIGKAQITLQQYNADRSQEMDVDFNRLNYSGDKDDFKKFFDELVGEISTVLGEKFYNNGASLNADLDNQESVFFKESGKSNDSHIEIDVFFLPKQRDVAVNFKIRKM